MAYINSGYQRATTLTIITKVNGVQNASNVLPMTEQFTYDGTTYPTVTGVEIQQMALADYNARAEAYAAYVQLNYQSQYPGLTVIAAGARVLNTVACPLP